jgi:hypothetical protein
MNSRFINLDTYPARFQFIAAMDSQGSSALLPSDAAHP